jgi:HTH-type transcriptional regulator/antitoxin HipB
MEYHIKTLDQLRPILVGLRKQAKLSQMAVASLLGVSQQSYAKIEANPSTTSFVRLFKILSLLGGEIIVNDRTSTDSSQTPNIDVKKIPSAPEKLIPSSKKPENW